MADAHGVVHTAVAAPFIGRWSLSVITAFFCFGVLTAISRISQDVLRKRSWPRPVNVIVNVALVCGSFDLGFRVDRLVGW